MSFVPNNIEINQYQTNNWEIRSQWQGELVNKKNLIPKNSYTEKYYLKPFILLSLVPQQSLKWGKVIKFYLGFDFRSIMNKFNPSSLEFMYSLFRFNFGFNINDKLEKGCTQVLTAINGQKLEYVNENLFSWSSKNKFNKINWKKPILIPLKCLKKGSKNFLKLWWSAKKNEIKLGWNPIAKNNLFLEETTRLKIDFNYPKKTTINFISNKNHNFKIKINYWYFIDHELGKKSKVIPVISKQIEIINEIKNEYKNSQPFKMFWKLIYEPINITINNWKLILKNFLFENFKKDLNYIQNWNQFTNLIEINTEVETNSQKHNILGILKEITKIKNIINLRIANYSKQPVASRNIYFYKYFFSHEIKTKNNWNIIKKQIIKNDFSQHTFLSGWEKANDEIFLINNFILKEIIPININFLQRTKFLNISWNKQITLKTIVIQPEISKPNSKKIINRFFINYLNLREIAFIKDFTLKKYLIFKNKWKKLS